MINLKALARIAPLEEDVKREMLEKADSMSSEKTMEIEEFLWGVISMDYQNKVVLEQQKLLEEIESGKRVYSKEDFENINEALFKEFVQKLEAANDSGKINEIREKLINPVSQQ